MLEKEPLTLDVPSPVAMCWASFLVSEVTAQCLLEAPLPGPVCVLFFDCSRPSSMPLPGLWSLVCPPGWHRQELGLALGSQPLLGLAHALLPLARALRAAPWVSHWGHLTGLGSRLLLQTNPFAHSDGRLPHDLARLQTQAGPLVSLLPAAPCQPLSCHGHVGF